MFHKIIAAVGVTCAAVFFFLAASGVDSPLNAALAAFALAAAVAFASWPRRAKTQR